MPVSLTFRLTYPPGRQPDAAGGVVRVDVRAGGGDDQLPAGRHGVAGVDGQVDQDLLDLARVGKHRAQSGGQVVGQFHVLAQGADEQLLDSFDHVVEVQRARLDDVAAGEGQQLAGERGGALGRPLDLLDVLPHGLPLVLRCSACDLLGDERGVVGDDGEQVVEVVRDPSG